MANSVHFVNIGPFRVDGTGKVINTSAAPGLASTTTSLNTIETANTEFRVIPNGNVPNSAGYPKIEDFLALEAAAGYKASIINQSQIILYNF